MKMTRKILCMLLTVALVLSLTLTNGNITKASAAAAEEQKVLSLNFEDGSMTGWYAHTDSVWNQQEYTKVGVIQDTTDAANKVLELCHYSKTDDYQLQQKLLAEVSTATLEYSFYLYAWSSTHRSYLPGLLYAGTDDEVGNIGTAPLGLYVQQNGTPNLYYNYGEGISRKQIQLAQLEYMQWYDVRIEYDLPNKKIDVYLGERGTELTKLELPTTQVQTDKTVTLTKTSANIDASAKLDRVSFGTSTSAHTWSYYDNITVSTTDANLVPLDTTKYFVKVNGNGAGIADGFAVTGTKGEDYALTVDPIIGHTYTVTATVGGQPVDVAKNGNTYTVANVSDELVYTITAVVNTDQVSVHRYMALQGTNMWLILQPEDLGDAHRATYGGKAMWYSPVYDAYAYLVVAQTISLDEAKAQIAVSEGKAATIDYSDDVNVSNKVDANDAQFVHNMYNSVYAGASQTETIRKFFLADANGDMTVDVKDAVTVCNGIEDYDPTALWTEDKVCATFGDSITWYDGNVYNSGKEEGQVAYGYQQYMLSDLYFAEVLNYGYSGAPMPYIINEVLLKLTDEAFWYDIDYVTITSGANDERLGTPLGTVAAKGSDFDTTTYIGALQAGIEYVLEMNPHIQIMLLTPIKGWIYAPLGYGANNVQAEDGVVTEKWANAIKEVAALYDLPVCDWYNNSGIDYEIADREAYMNDPEPPENQYYSLHPNTAGYKLMGEYLVKVFKQLQ